MIETKLISLFANLFAGVLLNHPTTHPYDPGLLDLVNCTRAEEVFPRILSNGEVTININSDCELENPLQKNLSHAKESALQRVLNSGKVRNGPFPAEYKGLQAEQFDVLVEIGGEDGLDVEQDVFVANDSAKVVFDQVSRKVIGKTSASSLIRKIDIYYDFSLKSDGKFHVNMKSFIRVRKPFYIPASKIAEISIEQYQTQRTLTIGEIAGNLSR